jgi:hypothetical protein
VVNNCNSQDGLRIQFLANLGFFCKNIIASLMLMSKHIQDNALAMRFKEIKRKDEEREA